MLNNFIYAQTKALFLEQLEAGNILDEAIVFIEDTKEIWNHGQYFGGDLENIDLSSVETEISMLKEYVDSKEDKPIVFDAVAANIGFDQSEVQITNEQIYTATGMNSLDLYNAVIGGRKVLLNLGSFYGQYSQVSVMDFGNNSMYIFFGVGTLTFIISITVDGGSFQQVDTLNDFYTKEEINNLVSKYGEIISISSIPVEYKTVKCTISENDSFALATTLAQGKEIHVIIYNSGSVDITVSLPTASPYVNFGEDSLTIPAGGYSEINVISDGSTMFIRHAA